MGLQPTDEYRGHPRLGEVEDVDARIKSAQDELKLFQKILTQVLIVENFSPNSPARKPESRSSHRLGTDPGPPPSPAFAGVTEAPVSDDPRAARVSVFDEVNLQIFHRRSSS